jgi:hypothetical protein
MDSDHLAVGSAKLLRVNAGGIVHNDRLQQLIGPRRRESLLSLLPARCDLLVAGMKSPERF